MVKSETVAVQVLKAFGLPSERCMSLTINFEHGHIVTVSTVYAAEQEGVDKMCETLSTVRLRVEE